MKSRRVIIIEEMFNNISTAEEQRKVSELYRINNKGSAVVFMLKRIRVKWNEFIVKTKTNNHISQFDSRPRLIKFTSDGLSTFESF